VNGTTRARGDLVGAAQARGISRRTLAKGTAWTAPVIIVGVASPAFAVSPSCVGDTASLTVGTKPTLLTFPPSVVTATVSFSSVGATGNDQTPGDTGEVHTTSYSPSWNYLKLHHPAGMDLGDTITLTVTFSTPVTALTLTITDIDKDTGEWIDQVIVNTPGYTAVKGPNVTGTGTAASPLTTSVNGGISSNAGDVKLTWPGPLTQVQLTYRAGDSQNGSNIGQHIGVGLIGFGNC
jgi:hypothetical protein